MAEQLTEVFSGIVFGICMGLIGVALTRLPNRPVARAVYAFVGACALWAVGDLVATVATDPFWKQAGLLTLYTGAITAPALWWLLALRWAEEVGADLPLKSVAWSAGPLAFAAVMWAAMATNPWHGEFITPVIGGRNVYQPLWYVMAVPNYGLILAALALEVTAARRVPRRVVRRQAAFMIAASLIVLAGNLGYIVGAVPVNLTSLLLAIAGTLIVVGMVRDGLFGVMPAALPTIAEQHPDGLVVVSADDRVLYANARARQILAPLDLEADVPIRTTLEAARLVPEARIGLDGASDAEWWRALSSDEGVLFHRDDAESPSWLHVTATEVHTRGRKQHGHSLRIADWTARHEAERQQRQSRRLESVGALARTVSRDLQASFSLIRGNADLIAEGGDATEADQRRLARIREATELGLDLAHQLQLYAGTVDASRTVLELSAIADEIRGVVADDLPDAVRIEFARSASPLPVAADPLQIRHGIFELLNNAVEATPEEGGLIRVETGTVRLDPAHVQHLVHGHGEPRGHFAYVLVSDEAGGMDAETEERAFEPFFSSRHKDRGNGLSTVLGVARAHGALVALDNQPGRGCTFTLYFPLEEDGGRGVA